MKDIRVTRPTQIDVDANFPVSGRARNIVTSGDGTGTPWSKDIINDRTFGWQERVLSLAGIVADGNEENASQSQIADALEILIKITSSGYNAAGSFQYGFTYTSDTDVGVYQGQAYKYVGVTDYPVEVSALTNPVDNSDYEVIAYSSKPSSTVINDDNSNAQNTYDLVKAILVSNGLSGEYGYFADGFTVTDLLDVGIDASFQFWKYVGAETPPYDVPAGTDPSAGDWSLVRFDVNYITYESISDMISGITKKAKVGDYCTVNDYYGGSSPSGSGVLFFKCVADGTGSEDGGKYIQGNGVQFEQNLKKPYDVRAWGGKADNSTDTKPAWDSMTAYIRQEFSGGEIIFFGDYYFSETPIFYSAFIYQGGGKGTTSINVPAGIDGVKINPAPENSVSYLEMRDFSIRSDNTYPSLSQETGLKIDLTAACRRLNIRDVEIKGFTNGLDGKCPFYLCTFKNINIEGIVPRDINDLANYTDDGSIGFASGFNDGAGDARDATTVTLENVFTSSFGTGIYNRYTSAMQLVNCVSERNFYGLLADKGTFGTMYQEWNKNSVRATGLYEPSGVNITAINEPSSWGPVTADTTSTARASKFRTLSPSKGHQVYSDVNPLVIVTSTNYLEFNSVNGDSITTTSAPSHRILGNYEIEVSFLKSNDPTVQGTYIFAILVKEDGEASYRTVKREFLKVVADDDFVGTLQFNYKGVTKGNLSNFRVGVSRVDGEAFTIDPTSVEVIIRELE